MSAQVGESSDHAVAGHHQIVDCRFDVGKRREEAGPEGPVGFTSVCHERVVVDVVDSHKASDGVGIVVVQHRQVTCRSVRPSVWLSVMVILLVDSWKSGPRPLRGRSLLLGHAAPPAREGEPDLSRFGILFPQAPGGPIDASYSSIRCQPR